MRVSVCVLKASEDACGVGGRGGGVWGLRESVAEGDDGVAFEHAKGGAFEGRAAEGAGAVVGGPAKDFEQVEGLVYGRVVGVDVRVLGIV